LAAVLALTPDQREVLTVLTREADILICADSDGAGSADRPGSGPVGW
jgi:hypothetical protein